MINLWWVIKQRTTGKKSSFVISHWVSFSGTVCPLAKQEQTDTKIQCVWGDGPRQTQHIHFRNLEMDVRNTRNAACNTWPDSATGSTRRSAPWVWSLIPPLHLSQNSTGPLDPPLDVPRGLSLDPLLDPPPIREFYFLLFLDPTQISCVAKNERVPYFGSIFLPRCEGLFKYEKPLDTPSAQVNMITSFRKTQTQTFDGDVHTLQDWRWAIIWGRGDRQYPMSDNVFGVVNNNVNVCEHFCQGVSDFVARFEWGVRACGGGMRAEIARLWVVALLVSASCCGASDPGSIPAPATQTWCMCVCVCVCVCVCA